MTLFGFRDGRCDEEAVGEVAGGETGAHGVKGFEVADKVRAKFRGQGPELFVFNNFESEVPGSGAVFVEHFAMRDLQTVRSEKTRVVVHGL